MVMSYKVLFIDDDKMLADTFSMIIEAEGYEGLQANTGNEGIELVKNELPDQVFIDVNMPDINGIELVRIIKDLHASCKIIMITGLLDKEIINKAMEEGASGFLVKPVDPLTLIKSINN
jgi:CheY-like chemotaxis protein